MYYCGVMLSTVLVEPEILTLYVILEYPAHSFIDTGFLAAHVATGGAVSQCLADATPDIPRGPCDLIWNARHLFVPVSVYEYEDEDATAHAVHPAPESGAVTTFVRYRQRLYHLASDALTEHSHSNLVLFELSLVTVMDGMFGIAIANDADEDVHADALYVFFEVFSRSTCVCTCTFEMFAEFDSENE